MIADMIREWENGAYCVLGIKRTSEEHSLMFWLRKQYYRLVERLSFHRDHPELHRLWPLRPQGCRTGQLLRRPLSLLSRHDCRDRAAHRKAPYDQPARKFGITKNNWYTLYDIGMLGIINNSKVPLRLAAFAGFVGASLSFLVALIYLILKLVFWSTFSFGLAPMLIGVFFISSLQLLFLGVMGEYVGPSTLRSKSAPMPWSSIASTLNIPLHSQNRMHPSAFWRQPRVRRALLRSRSSKISSETTQSVRRNYHHPTCHFAVRRMPSDKLVA